MSRDGRIFRARGKELMYDFLDQLDRSGLHFEDLSNDDSRAYWTNAGWGDVYLLYDEICRRLESLDRIRAL